jgi:hypothetical protein
MGADPREDVRVDAHVNLTGAAPCLNLEFPS